MSGEPRRLRAVTPVDNVARWRGLLAEYPQARYTFYPPYYVGVLREADDVMQRTDLGVLIDALLAREDAQGAPG